MIQERNIKGIKISRLDEALEIRKNDYFPIVQDGVTKKVKGDKLVVDLSNYYTKEEVDSEIDKVKLLTTGVKFDLLETDFIATRSITLYRAILNHNLNLPLEGFSVSFYDIDKNNVSLDYKIIDNNSIEIQSDLPVRLIIAIKQAIQVQSHSHDEDYSKLEHNHDSSYSKLSHKHDMSDIENLIIPEVDLSDYYNKTETYNKKEVEKLISRGAFNKDWGKLDVYNDTIKNTLLHEDIPNFNPNSTRVVNYNDNKIVYMLKGRNNYGDLNILDINSGTIEHINAGIPSGNCIVEIIGNDVYVLGGMYAPGHGYTTYTSRTFKKYSLETKEWTTLADYHKYIANTTSAVCNGEIYVYGGRYTDGSSGGGETTGFRKYNIELNKWIELPISGYQEDYRSWYLFSVENQYVYGVASYYYTHQIKRFNTITETWEAVTNFPESVESCNISSTISTGEKVYIFGQNRDTDGNAKVYVYDIPSNSWDKNSVRYPFTEAARGYSCLMGGTIKLLFIKDNKKQVYEYVPVGNTLNPKVEVSLTKGSTKDLARYPGIQAQLVVNTETKRLHLMDGATKGGTIIPNMSDLENLGGEGIEYIETFEQFKEAVSRQENILHIKPNATIKFTEKVTINTFQVQIEGNGAIFEFTGLNQGLDINFSNNNPTTTVLKNLIVKSPGNKKYYTVNSNGGFEDYRYCIRIRGGSTTNSYLAENCLFVNTDKHGLYLWTGIHTNFCNNCHFNGSGIFSGNCISTKINNCSLYNSYSLNHGSSTRFINCSYVSSGFVCYNDNSTVIDTSNFDMSNIFVGYHRMGLNFTIKDSYLSNTFIKTGGFLDGDTYSINVKNCTSNDSVGSIIQVGINCLQKPYYNFDTSYNEPISEININSKQDGIVIDGFLGESSQIFIAVPLKTLYIRNSTFSNIRSVEYGYNSDSLYAKNSKIKELEIRKHTLDNVDYDFFNNITIQESDVFIDTNEYSVSVSSLDISNSKIEIESQVDIKDELKLNNTSIINKNDINSLAGFATIKSNANVLLNNVQFLGMSKDFMIKYENKDSCKVIEQNCIDKMFGGGTNMSISAAIVPTKFTKINALDETEIKLKKITPKYVGNAMKTLVVEPNIQSVAINGEDYWEMPPNGYNYTLFGTIDYEYSRCSSSSNIRFTFNSIFNDSVGANYRYINVALQGIREDDTLTSSLNIVLKKYSHGSNSDYTNVLPCLASENNVDYDIFGYTSLSNIFSSGSKLKKIKILIKGDDSTIRIKKSSLFFSNKLLEYYPSEWNSIYNIFTDDRYSNRVVNISVSDEEKVNTNTISIDTGLEFGLRAAYDSTGKLVYDSLSLNNDKTYSLLRHFEDTKETKLLSSPIVTTISSITYNNNKAKFETPIYNTDCKTRAFCLSSDSSADAECSFLA